MKRPAVTLDDKYLQPDGQIFLTANQALVRLPLEQARRDRARGLPTAGFISGYRGSPLGVYDAALWQAQAFLDEHNIVFQPGLNEELALSAIRGTQQLDWFEKRDVEGVFGLWYGKGIGVDRACEAIKLGNLEGTAATGGILVVAGDDHGGKSSDSAHQSEHTLIAAMVPIIYPSTIAEIIEFGLIGWEMSRFSGCYVGLKTVTDTLDLSACIDLPPSTISNVRPRDAEIPENGFNLHQNLPPLVEEQRLVTYRLPAASAFARANGIDRVTVDGECRQLGIVSAGKAYLDVCQAMQDLGLDAQRCRQLGIRVYKPGLIWPMDPEGLCDFAKESKALLVIEEKRPIMEDQIARQLYSLDTQSRPALAGKVDLVGAPLLPSIGELSATQVRQALLRVLDQLNLIDSALAANAARYQSLVERASQLGSQKVRPAYFCSGCPHNTSTRVPEGSRAMGGIGCHGLAAVVMDRDTMQFLPMGHEGSGWVGVSQFVDTPHMFQNMGDGTYSHSGILAIRAAVAQKTPITYKILYNDAVAMTGGQPVESAISPIGVAQQLLAEGVQDVRLVSDQPNNYTAGAIPSGLRIHHRDDLDSVQRALRDIPGVTAIIYEQTCAAEKRRRRKRGLMDKSNERVFINPEVCEGCGDCSQQSNCMSILPLETEFGRKRMIDQSSCNMDFSCLKGFCPSFVSVSGADIAVHSNAQADQLESRINQLPAPNTPDVDDRGYNILITGIGGTGVLTVGALLGMAAHIEGLGCTVLDMTGMAQKGGSVSSHVRLSRTPTTYSARLGEGMTDLLLACDMIGGAAPAALKTLRLGAAQAVVNADVAPTGEFHSNNFLNLDEAQLQSCIEEALAGGSLHVINASRLATELTGDSIGTNILMLGFALQKGLLPVSIEALKQAIRLNGAAVESNLQTLDLGRLLAHDPEVIASNSEPEAAPDTLEALIERRSHHLTAYQNAAYAQDYQRFLTAIAARISTLSAQYKDRFLREIALTLSRLMAYKDEYEVARLYVDPQFKKRLHAQFSGNYKLSFHMAPPMFLGKDALGRPKKRRFGPWMLSSFEVLSRLKVLRGSPFDLFGYTSERRMERQLIADYRELVMETVAHLNDNNVSAGIDLVAAAGRIAGYGPVKMAAIAAYRGQLPGLKQQFMVNKQGTIELQQVP